MTKHPSFVPNDFHRYEVHISGCTLVVWCTNFTLGSVVHALMHSKYRVFRRGCVWFGALVPLIGAVLLFLNQGHELVSLCTFLFFYCIKLCKVNHDSLEHSQSQSGVLLGRAETNQEVYRKQEVWHHWPKYQFLGSCVIHHISLWLPFPFVFS